MACCVTFSGEGKKGMLLPTMDQTEGIWIARTNDQGYHFIQEVFPKKTEIDQAHRANCRSLIQRGSLQPEQNDHIPSSQRGWNSHERYWRKHI